MMTLFFKYLQSIINQLNFNTMENLFQILGNMFNPANDIKTVIKSRLELPFNYSLTFQGKGSYSNDGQLWGVNQIRITKSKTSICIALKNCKDVHDFHNTAFIRSIDELKNKIDELANKYPEFFADFGTISIY